MKLIVDGKETNIEVADVKFEKVMQSCDTVIIRLNVLSFNINDGIITVKQAL